MNKYLKYLPSIIVLVAGIVVSVMLFTNELKKEEAKNKEYLEKHILERRYTIENEMKSILNILRLFQHDWDFPYNEFRQLALPILSSHMDISNLYWIEEIEHERISLKSKELLTRGVDDFKLIEFNTSREYVSAEKRDIYYPVIFTGTSTNNLFEEGFDLGSIKNVKGSIDNAIETQEVVITECLTEFRDSVKNIFIILPVFDTNNDSGNNKKETLKGFIIAELENNKFIENSLTQFKKEAIWLNVTDVTIDSESKEIYSNINKLDILKESFKYNITIANRIWELEFYVPESLKRNTRSLSILIIGIIFTIILTFYLMTIVSKSNKVKKLSKSLFIEIEEKNKIEKILRESENKFRLLYENAPLSYQSFDANGCFLDVNKTWLSTLGYSREEVIGHHFSEFMTPESAALVKPRFEDFKKVGELHDFQFEMVCKDKTQLYVSYEGKIGYDNLGNFQQTHCIFQDITESRKARIELKASEEKYREFVEGTDDLIIQVDGKGIFIFVNHKAEQIFGFKPEECKGKSAFEFVHPDDIEMTKREFNVWIKDKVSNVTFENRSINAEGKSFSLLWTISFHYDQIGNVKEINGIATNITERKKAEMEIIAAKEKAEENELKYKDLVNTSQSLIWRCDLQGQFTYLNAAWEETHGYKIDEMLGKPFSDFQRPEVYARDVVEFSKHLAGGSVKNYETTHIIKNGSEISLIFSAIPLYDLAGNVIGTQGTAFNITDRVLNEKLLKEAKEKVEESERKLSRSIFAAPFPIMIHAEDGEVVAINDVWVELTGYTHKLIPTITDWTKKAYRQKSENRKEYIDKLYLIDKKVEEGEYEIFTSKGEKIIWDFSSAPLGKFTDGRRLVISMAKDVTKQKERDNLILKTIIDTEEKERKRFAEDLHDELGPFLSGIKLYIKELGYQDVSYEQRISIIEYLNEFINSAVEKTRTISNQLMPNVLTNYGLVKALNSFCSKISNTKEINIEFKSNITERINNTTIEVILYRITIELINNTIKHAEANMININLSKFNEILQLTYEDNGKGFDIEKELKKETGLGLNNMVNRLNSIKGKYSFHKISKGMHFNIIIDLSLT